MPTVFFSLSKECIDSASYEVHNFFFLLEYRLLAYLSHKNHENVVY